jgi:tRNA-uridine 2-sulfurtransferase
MIGIKRNFNFRAVIEMKKTLKIAVGVSGGVDSALAAYLLKKQGHEVVGFTMKIWSGRKGKNISGRNACYGPSEKKDIQDAREAMRRLGIEHRVLDLTREYEKEVLEYFRREYLAGRTPNPCVICNQKIKFGFLLKRIFLEKDGFDFFATGHYAQVEYAKKQKRFLLKSGSDAKKDQAYFLYRLNQEQLGKIIFPLGEKKKEAIKKIAREIGLEYFAEKPESQDFIENKDRELIFGPKQKKPGKIVDMQGKVLGQHDGIWNFTIGQRKGINLGGMAEPYYVANIDACKNLVIVGPKRTVFADTFFLKDANWIAFEKLEKKISAKVKLRSSSAAVACQIIPADGKIKIKLKKPQFAITAGQSAVFYQKDIVLGGGIISLK